MDSFKYTSSCNSGHEPAPAVSTKADDNERLNDINSVGQTVLFGKIIHTLYIGGVESLCLAQISASLLNTFSYNEIHNRRVALGISCIQCTPSQLELLRKTGALPATSRRCGMITRAQAERLVRSFLCPAPPPALPESFTFRVCHNCAYGCSGLFYPARYNSSRAKCISCTECSEYFSPNKFVFHSHQPDSMTKNASSDSEFRKSSARYTPVNAANFNSWRKHVMLDEREDDPKNAGLNLHVIDQLWEDIKTVFNGGVVHKQQTAASSAASKFNGDKSVDEIKPAPDALFSSTIKSTSKPCKRFVEPVEDAGGARNHDARVQLKRRKNARFEPNRRCSQEDTTALNSMQHVQAPNTTLNFTMQGTSPKTTDISAQVSNTPFFSSMGIARSFVPATPTWPPVPLTAPNSLLLQQLLSTQTPDVITRYYGNAGAAFTVPSDNNTEPVALSTYGGCRQINGAVQFIRGSDNLVRHLLFRPCEAIRPLAALPFGIGNFHIPAVVKPQNNALFSGKRISAFSRCFHSVG